MSARVLLVLCVSVWCASVEAQEAPEEKADAFYLQAIQLFNEGRYQEALENFDRAIALNPVAVFFCNRGTVLMKLDERAEALVSMESCLSRFEVTDEESAAEKAQIDAEVGALRLVVRGLVPASARVATNIATKPEGEDRTKIVIVEPIDEGVDMWAVGAWGAAGVAGASLLGALVLDLVTQPVIEDFKRTAEAGDNRERYDALRGAIDQRKVVIGALVVAGSVSAIASGVLFWAGTDSDSGGAPRRGEVEADIQLLDGGAALQFGVAF